MKHRIIITGLLTISALIVAQYIRFTPRIIYNATVSVPTGFYIVTTKKNLKIGDLIVLKLPRKFQRLAENRQYVGPGMPLLKHIMALKGDEVCSGNFITVNGKTITKALKTDSAGRKMPHWQGCYTLKANEFFALNPDVQTSFDGRYFGILSTNLIIGRAHPLWNSVSAASD